MLHWPSLSTQCVQTKETRRQIPVSLGNDEKTAHRINQCLWPYPNRFAIIFYAKSALLPGHGAQYSAEWQDVQSYWQLAGPALTSPALPR